MAKVKNEISAVDLLEEALHLLRRDPASLTCYYLGSVPFVLGLLFFWADMSRSAYAAGRCASASFTLALAYLWMKCWQAGFTRSLRRRVGASAGDPWGWRQLLRLVATQTVVQPWGLVLFLPALLLTIPFPAFFAFFQNVTVLGVDERKGINETVRRAWTQAVLWSGQNGMLCFYVTVFSLLVFVNVVLTLFALPHLLKMFLGVQSRFIQSPEAFLNTTFLAAACALTYLAVDPLVKAAYVLRCFHGESLRTGEAIWVELERLKKLGGALILALVLTVGLPAAGRAQFAPEPPARPVSPAELDRSIQETLRSPRYTWRMPRQLKQRPEDENKSFLGLFLDSVFRTVRGWFDAVLHGIGKVVGWMIDLFRPKNPRDLNSAAGFAEGIFTLTKVMLYLLAMVVLITAGFFLWRLWHQRSRLLTLAMARPAAQAAMPDLSDERTVADQIPSDGWLTLAQQMIDRGELRLALRALYLASLAALAQAGLIRIRRSKSNLDYARELLRRAHAWPGLMESFSQSMTHFDRAWYGMHEVTPEGLQDFKANTERIRSLVH